ncbi:MAG TPA: tRNA (adenosine(37)-N6)-threonylcarbamoyltransferase complex dimerization subunit type 1 TsaB [Arenimonas sp.]|uniref:tRNA (adenosine(37)-N6)-threonylcarbamoyltransferase complex dimerization subunit type 1 TsaB n=1 Tax=Arenimonas sp. TaxID=1872635 RepID=UPI002D7FD60E|nr:tRNA (adenosine(37)-N6)-threonylcarbamoyltransferase complex dimerization subunit type 1 TsaB [Arenimonas sp.]HEU0153304.1 tRNA (adenosine(37)-N6)-threonylcarbamoyltransferase complex dimerization subunit type 1 TsaB [Arenimonas sp.]
MKLLAIETSTEACSVAVYVDGEVRERHELAPRRHTQQVLPWADELLAEAGLRKSQLDAIAVGRGPGAFTGVRLAIALVQGLALALDRPVLPVSTLAVLAMQAPGDDRLAAIDARMGEVYLGAFRRDADGLVSATGDERIVPPAAATLPAGEVHGVGTGFGAEQGALVARLGARLRGFDANALPHAADLARLAARAYARGEAIAPDLLEPAYLRDKVALTLAEQGKPKPSL